MPREDGSDIYLTIDRNVQFIAETALKEGVEKYSARSGSVIVINPKTGEVIAMANYPTYSPAVYTDSQENEEVYRNNAISTIYEPGSVMKALTMSSAIDLGIVTPETVYLDDEPKYFSGHKVDNWDEKHHGEETMVEILQHSNNLGAAWVGGRVGSEQLLNYLHKFGFGARLGIDIEGEEGGLIYTSYPLKDIELANASFGQGISATPLQIMSVFSAIANNGYLMKPYVVSKITSSDGDTEVEPEIFSRPISEKTAETMVDMLTQAAAGGEAKYFVLKNFNTAGKTGTAQVPSEGGYDEDKTNATFAGFLSSYKNFVMLVRLEEPSSPSGFAAETSVPLWMGIASKLTNYYSFVPDK